MLVFVIGAPGSGKGTLCRKLCTEFGYSHLSLGDRLRHLMQTRREDLKQHVIERIKKSELLPTADLMPILQTAIQSLEDAGAKAILLDGFPRNIEQVRFGEGIVLQPDLVLFFDCPGDIARDRYMTRALPGRDSDPRVFEKRYQEFQKLNKAVLQEYEHQGVLITIDTSGPTERSYGLLLQALRALELKLCSIEQTEVV